jgi:hypothetical protein
MVGNTANGRIITGGKQFFSRIYIGIRISKINPDLFVSLEKRLRKIPDLRLRKKSFRCSKWRLTSSTISNILFVPWLSARFVETPSDLWHLNNFESNVEYLGYRRKHVAAFAEDRIFPCTPKTTDLVQRDFWAVPLREFFVFYRQRSRRFPCSAATLTQTYVSMHTSNSPPKQKPQSSATCDGVVCKAQERTSAITSSLSGISGTNASVTFVNGSSDANEERLKMKEQWLREEIRAGRILLLRTLQWGVAMLAAVESYLYYVRRDVVTHLTQQNALHGGSLPLPRWIIGTCFLALLAWICSTLMSRIVSQHQSYRRQLVGLLSYSGIVEEQPVGGKIGKSHYWLFFAFPFRPNSLVLFSFCWRHRNSMVKSRILLLQKTERRNSLGFLSTVY